MKIQIIYPLYALNHIFYISHIEFLNRRPNSTPLHPKKTPNPYIHQHIHPYKKQHTTHTEQHPQHSTTIKTHTTNSESKTQPHDSAEPPKYNVTEGQNKLGHIMSRRESARGHFPRRPPLPRRGPGGRRLLGAPGYLGAPAKTAGCSGAACALLAANRPRLILAPLFSGPR